MCAIFGTFGVKNAAAMTAIGLHNVQHRAIDYAGMVTWDRHAGFHLHHGTGIARQVFTPNVLAGLHGDIALGHLRYPTVADDPGRTNIQPVTGRYGGMPIAIAHNGNITNVPELSKLVPLSRIITSMDTELLVRLLEQRQTGDIEADLASILGLVKGSYALGIVLPDRFIAVRDPSGNRPLSIATINGGYCISSETCAFTNMNAVKAFDVEPGTIVSLSREKGIRIQRFAQAVPQLCRFETLYYSHPGSIVFGEPVAEFRMALGRALEETCPVPEGSDIVVPIPDSSMFIAMGYAENGRSGKYFPAIVRNHYVGRTFIAANQPLRIAEAMQKFTFIGSEISGKRIVLVDDSIVRCTTLPIIVAVLRQLGAAAIHVRIGSPPIKHPCIYGINTPSLEELISASKSADEIRQLVEADSLEFLPLERLRKMSPSPGDFCYACMDGSYW